MYIIADTYADAYQKLRTQFLSEEALLLVSPRGIQTKEMLQVTVEIAYPRYRLGWHPQRHYSLPFALAEAIQLFDNDKKLAPIQFINSRIKRFSDDGETLYGAYGPRLTPYFTHVIEKLKKDKDSRQVILPIIRQYDIEKEATNNYPCTISLQFAIRKNTLFMFTQMRSNDFVWGFPYDVFMFTCLQEIIANELGIDVGPYYHTTSSLHVYEETFHFLEEVDHFVPICMSLPYRLADMPEFVSFVRALKTYRPQDIERETEDTLKLIFASFLRAKQHLEYKSTHIEWAEPFMYDLYIEKNPIQVA